MKKTCFILTAMLAFTTVIFAAPVSDMIVVDQIGYRVNSDKWFMIKNPQTGYDSAITYVPGANAELRRSSDEAVMMTIPLTAWNGGAEDTDFSGDVVRQGDFSSFTTPGTYHIYDPANDRQSYDFEIGDNIYNGALEASVKSYFFNRSNIEITSTHGGVWTHALDHTQQASANLYDNGDRGNPRDIRLGWFDAGDYRKYTSWMAPVIWDLAYAYEWYSDRFSDSTDIPESGNGVPDILDEIKWELDWLLNMQRADGALYSGCFVVSGSGSNGDPSWDTSTYYYSNFSTAATASGAASFAIGARLFAAYTGAYPGYSAALRAAAENAWAFLAANTSNITYNHTGFSNADSNQTAEGDNQLRLMAAAELFKLTGDPAYQSYVDANYDNANTTDGTHQPIINNYFETGASSRTQRALVSYASAPGATGPVVTAIHTAIRNGIDWNITGNLDNDPYKSFMWGGHYCWGSNGMKAGWANVVQYGIELDVNPSMTETYRAVAEEYLHYFHGRNAAGYCYLTQSQLFGADKSITEIYHSWFWDGSAYDTNPAPGFLAGGPNQYFAPDASYGGTIEPPQNQPPMKSYLDWNTSWPENSWEITENSTGYQSRHVLLNAMFAGPAGPVPTATNTPTNTPFAGTPTFTFTITQTPTITMTYTYSPTPDVSIFNTCDTIDYNGAWAGSNASRSINTTNTNAITQGTGALQVDVTTAAAWNDQAANLSGFTPSDWSNIDTLEMDIYVEPGSAPWDGASAWHQLSLYADSSAASKWYRKIAADQTIDEGMNHVVFTIDWTLDTETDPILATDLLSNLMFILNCETGATGTFYIDNMTLVMATTPTFTQTPDTAFSSTFTPTISMTPTETPFGFCSKRFLAYYPYWEPGYKQDKIPYDKLTHICHAFLQPQADGSLIAPAGYMEPELITNAHLNGVKVLASIGGADAAADANFTAIAASPALRTAFADAVYDFCLVNGYDGVDIDWEFPGDAADRTNQNLLFRAVRDKFDSSPDPAPSLEITMAVSTGSWYGQWNDYAELNLIVDFYNGMTYDYHGSWSAHSGHNSALYRGADPEAGANCDEGIEYLLSRGIPAEMINMGIPFYGRQFVNSETLYDDCSGDCTENYLLYYQIEPVIGAGWTYNLDAGSQVPYLTYDSGPGLTSYDDPSSVALKVEYALTTQNLGGVFMWEITGDYMAGSQPLLDAMHSAYLENCVFVTATATPTITASETYTYTPTATLTATPAASSTMTATNTNTPYYSPTFTSTDTPTDAPTDTPTDTFTRTGTPTYTYTSTGTPTATPSVTSTFTYTITNTSTPTSTNTPTSTSTSGAYLEVQILATPDFVNVGEAITVIMSVTNTGNETANNVIPSALAVNSTNGGDAVYASGPDPANETIAPGSSAYFTWIYDASASGFVEFEGSASGTDAVGGWIVTGNTDAGNIVGIGVAPPTATPTFTYTPSSTSTSTFTLTDTPTLTFTFTLTDTPSATLTNTGTFTHSPTITDTPEGTLTHTPTITVTDTATPSDTPTDTPTHTPTATITDTDTPGPSATFTSTFTVTDTSTEGPTATPTFTPTDTDTVPPDTHTFTSTATLTYTATPTPSATLSFTPTITLTPAFSRTYTLTCTPQATFTATQTATAGATALPDETGILEIDDEEPVVVFPNPNPGINAEGVSIRFNITKRAQKAKFRMFTVSYRMIREVEIDASSVTGGLYQGTNVMHIPGNIFAGIARGTYFYVIFVEDNIGNTDVSKVEKIIILR